MDAPRRYRTEAESSSGWAETPRRSGSGSRAAWIRATYIPILDLNGRPSKAVNYATDISRQVQARQRAADSAGVTLGNVQSVAAANEQFTGSVAEIARSMEESRQMVRDMHGRAQAADAATRRLTEATLSMDSIVQLIERIASQI